MMILTMGLAAMALLLEGEPVTATQLGWMSGSWEARIVQAEGAPTTWTDELWTHPRGGMLAGIGRRGQGTRLGMIEFLTIQPDSDGTLVLDVLQAGEQAPTRFRLARVGVAEAVFENPQHDYPQRISYRREGSRPIAAISRLDGTDERSWTFDAQANRP
jgi:hypothetical protein